MPDEPLDLTKNDPPPAPGLADPPRSEPWNPEPGREKIRGRLAYGFALLVGGLAITSFVFVPFGYISADKAIGAFTAVVALAGTAVGFYFGGRNH